MSNNSAEINNTEINNSAMTKVYKIDVADRTGHTTLMAEGLDQATDKILTHAENTAHWVYINGAKFEFEGTNLRTEKNVTRLKTALQVVEDPLVVLTGKLVGGQA